MLSVQESTRKKWATAHRNRYGPSFGLDVDRIALEPEFKTWKVLVLDTFNLYSSGSLLMTLDGVY